MINKYYVKSSTWTVIGTTKSESTEHARTVFMQLPTTTSPALCACHSSQLSWYYMFPKKKPFTVSTTTDSNKSIATFRK
jgi:hypothetical protein